MRGSDPIDDQLYEGTAKSAQGYLAGICFEKGKDEGCVIEINWQDRDSSSEKSFRSVYGSETSARVMKCGGMWVGHMPRPLRIGRARRI